VGQVRRHPGGVGPMSATQVSIGSDLLDEALWWVQRWVSGSMGDPDWEEGWLSHVRSIEEAFPIVQAAIGNVRSRGRTLWRYIAVSQGEAERILATKTLLPHEFPYQSFTTSARLAFEVGAELERDGELHLLVSADVPDGDVMFGMADLMASKAAGDCVLGLGDWHHQEEIVVRVDRPLSLTEVRRVDWALGPDAGLSPSRP